jgi:hypothetical protein
MFKEVDRWCWQKTQKLDEFASFSFAAFGIPFLVLVS